MLVVSSAAHAGLLTPEAGGSPNADAIDTLYWLVFGLGVIIFIGVEGVLIYSLFKFRARKGAVAAQIHGNTQLEIGWTVGAAVILVVHRDLHVRDAAHDPQPAELRRRPPRAPPGSRAASRSPDREKLPPNGKSLTINVNGQQYVWRYTYADGDDNPLNNVFSYEEMVVPVDDDGDAEHPRPGRRALLVDPAARRQVRRHPEAHELHVVQDPGRQGGQHLPRAVRRAVRAQPREHDRARSAPSPRRSSTSWLERQAGRRSRPPTTPPREQRKQVERRPEPVKDPLRPHGSS